MLDSELNPFTIKNIKRQLAKRNVSRKFILVDGDYIVEVLISKTHTLKHLGIMWHHVGNLNGKWFWKNVLCPIVATLL